MLLVALDLLLVTVLLKSLFSVSLIKKVLYSFPLIANSLQMLLLDCRVRWQWMTVASQSDILRGLRFLILFRHGWSSILKITLSLFWILGWGWPLNYFSTRAIKVALASLRGRDNLPTIAWLSSLEVVCLLTILLLNKLLVHHEHLLELSEILRRMLLHITSSLIWQAKVILQARSFGNSVDKLETLCILVIHYH